MSVRVRLPGPLVLSALGLVAVMAVVLTVLVRRDGSAAGTARG